MANLRRVSAILAFGMAFLGIAYGAFANGESCPITTPVGGDWLATGTITKVDGPVFYMLGKDNQVYEVRAGDSRFIVNDNDGATYTPTVGDTVRVFGKVTKGCMIDASRVRIYGGPGAPAASGGGPTTAAPSVTAAPAMPTREIKIIIEKEPAPGKTAAPEVKVALPAPDWDGRGLIMDIDYTGRTLKVRTSTGQFTIHLTQAQLFKGAKPIKFGSLNAGDAVWVCGNSITRYEIAAQQVYVTRSRDEAINAVPQSSISQVGIVRTIDYPSMTFTLQTEGPEVVVLADKDTVLQVYTKPAVFTQLKPGSRVKVSGYGNLANGYVARHIQIISSTP